MHWGYALIIVLLFGGYLFVHFLRVRHTRRMEELIQRSNEAPDGEPGHEGMPPDITREMIQNGDDDKTGGE